MQGTTVPFPVRGADIHVGDSIAIGGLAHTVEDVRSVADGHKRRLEFSDGNVYVLGSNKRIEVTRLPSAASLGRGARRARRG